MKATDRCGVHAPRCGRRRAQVTPRYGSSDPRFGLVVVPQHLFSPFYSTADVPVSTQCGVESPPAGMLIVLHMEACPGMRAERLDRSHRHMPTRARAVAGSSHQPARSTPTPDRGGLRQRIFATLVTPSQCTRVGQSSIKNHVYVFVGRLADHSRMIASGPSRHLHGEPVRSWEGGEHCSSARPRAPPPVCW